MNVVYTVPNVSGVTYNWSYTGTGASFSSTTNTVSVNFSTTATSGDLKVTASTSCGTSSERKIAVNVKPYITWQCNTNNDWYTNSNWDAGFAPYGTISVLIPSSASCQPSITTGTAEVRDFMSENGSKVTIDCNAGLTVKGNVDLDGVVAGCGTMNLKGNDVQKITGNGSVSNLYLDNTSGATIKSGDTIHITSTYKPGSGNLTTNGGLELMSDENGTAVILQAVNCNYIIGDVIVNKYIPGGRRAFRFLGHPFSHSIGLDQLQRTIDVTGQDGAANGFTNTITNNPSAFWYNTLTGNGSTIDDVSGWIPFTHTNGQGANAWNKGQGIRVLIRGAKGEGLQSCCDYTPSASSLRMNGPVNQCDVVVATETNNNMGFNFIGNPYPANIEMSQAVRGSAINANFSVWDPNQGIAGAYVDQPFAYSYILPAYSAFFVRSNANTNNTISFFEGMKTGAAPTANLFKTTSTYGNNSVQLRIVSNNDSVSWDRLLLFFKDQSIAGTEDVDALKMGNPNLDFYTYSANNDKLSIDVRPMVRNEVIRLGFDVDVFDRTFSVRVDDYNIPEGTQLYLHDKFLNVVKPMSQGMHYDFTVSSSDVNSQGANRFEINVSDVVTGVNEVAAGTVNLVMLPNPATDNVMISFEAQKTGAAEIKISNLMGQQVYGQNLGNVKAAQVNVPLQQLANGIYMVTIKCGNQTITERLVKQ